MRLGRNEYAMGGITFEVLNYDLFDQSGLAGARRPFYREDILDAQGLRQQPDALHVEVVERLILPRLTR